MFRLVFEVEAIAVFVRSDIVEESASCFCVKHGSKGLVHSTENVMDSLRFHGHSEVLAHAKPIENGAFEFT